MDYVEHKPLMQCSGLRTLRDVYYSDGGRNITETCCCSLNSRCKSPAQIRVTRSNIVVLLQTSDEVHTQAHCHATDYSKFPNIRQRIDVAKILQVNSATRKRSTGCSSIRVKAGLGK